MVKEGAGEKSGYRFQMFRPVLSWVLNWGNLQARETVRSEGREDREVINIAINVRWLATGGHA